LSEEPKKWGGFFVEEYQRAFKEAETSPIPFEILDSLEETTFMREDGSGFSDEIIKICAHYLDHKKVQIRYKAIWLLDCWIDEKNQHNYKHIIQKITRRLNDENWKIRSITHSALDNWNALPKNFSPLLMDRIRAYFGSIYSI